MLYKIIIAICSQIHKNHVNTLYGQKAEFFSVNICSCIKQPLDFKVIRENYPG